MRAMMIASLALLSAPALAFPTAPKDIVVPSLVAAVRMECLAYMRPTRFGTCVRLGHHPFVRYFFASITWMPLLPLTTCVTRRSAARLQSV